MSLIQRLLGLLVGSAYGVFGVIEVLKPEVIAKHFLDLPSQPSSEADRAVSLLGRLLGARDLTIAVLVLGFQYAAKYREAGIVIVAGTILCYADALAVWSARGPRP